VFIWIWIPAISALSLQQEHGGRTVKALSPLFIYAFLVLTVLTSGFSVLTSVSTKSGFGFSVAPTEKKTNGIGFPNR
jgi:uncharacterized membrane protein YadS